jgi:hypothetical protein
MSVRSRNQSAHNVFPLQVMADKHIDGNVGDDTFCGKNPDLKRNVLGDTHRSRPFLALKLNINDFLSEEMCAMDVRPCIAFLGVSMIDQKYVKNT